MQYLYYKDYVLIRWLVLHIFVCLVSKKIVQSRETWSCCLMNHVLDGEVGGSNLGESVSFLPGCRLALTD